MLPANSGRKEAKTVDDRQRGVAGDTCVWRAPGGVHSECIVVTIHYFHKRNLDFEEMRYRVHCLSKNKQNVSFKHLMNGQYQPPLPGKTLQRYYIDLRELNAMFQE